MKIRDGFVSNSSSTSFTCDACNYSEPGHDSSSIEEYGLIRLNCEHEICEEHLLEISNDEYQKRVVENLTNEIEENEKYNSEHLYDNYKYDTKPAEKILKKIKDGISRQKLEDMLENIDHSRYLKEQCPVCSLKMIKDSIVFKYLLKSIDIETVKTEIREKFSSFDELKTFLNKK